ncbi:site-specific integrase [Runella sp. SP2]|uniref:site-specific integrase n=1 Tax=Runella sp. SP2 TaxID=2268026 RepID=UPI000F084331|nr:site-specific integrase [Runella sp. SP2]AYQ34949.1 site-specific integrase [Runella sp. SP2]
MAKLKRVRNERTGIKFEVIRPELDSPRPIYLVACFDKQRVRINTGQFVLSKWWGNNKVRLVSDFPNARKINDRLHKIEVEALGIIEELRSELTLTKDTFRQKIEAFLTPVPVPVVPTESPLFAFIREFIEKSPERVNPSSGKKIEYRTIQKYKTVFDVLQEFGKGYSRKIDFDSMDLDFYGDFTEYLTNRKKFAANNVGKYIQTLKTFLNEATAKGINVKADYKSRRFKVVKESADSIYLTEAELQALYEFDLSKNVRLERVRDLFLVGCWTGLRFSDLTNVRPEHVKEGVIRLEQAKTGGKVVIPCHPIVKAILGRYDGNLPRAISNQKMNDYLKELCRLSGMDELVHKSITKAGVRITQTFEKWELVSTHTARRSFATNAYKMDIPTITIMKITGHRTEKAFLSYIKLSEEEHAQIIAAAWEGKQKRLFEVSK